MTSLELRRIAKTAAEIAVLALCIAPDGVFGQEGAADDSLRQIVASIGEAESQNPILYPELIEPLLGLGRLYHEEGDYALAIAAVEQARQIVRVNYGLYSVEEVPLLAQLALSEQARGNVATAWAIEQDLLALMERHPTDPRIVPHLRALGDKRLNVLRRYDSGGFPPEIVLGCYYSDRGNRNCRAGSRSTVKRRLVNEALSYHWHAMTVVVQNEGYTDDALPEQLMELVRLAYRHGSYVLGRRSLRYLHAYETANSEPWNSLILMADWDLVFGNESPRFRVDDSVADTYRRAYALLEQEGVGQAIIDDIFSPQIPAVLPSFVSHRLDATGSSGSSAYVDVAFDIKKDGTSARVEVLDTTSASRDAQRELVRLIKRSTFRPRISDGEIVDSARVTVRYYVDELQS